MIRRNRLFFCYLLLFIVIQIISSCSMDKEQSPEGLFRAETQFSGVLDVKYQDFETGKFGGQFTFAVQNDPNTFNDVKAVDSSSTDITNLLYASLVERSQQDLKWKPMLSKSWSFSDDQRTITHTIKKGLKWSDGMELDARDFVFAYNHIILREDIESNLRDRMFVNDLPVTVKLIDDYTFSITTDMVYAGLLSLSQVHPYPRHIWGPVIGWSETDGYDFEYSLVDGKVKEENPHNLKYANINTIWGTDADVSTIVGNGPFTVSKYEKRSKITLQKNPFYFETDDSGNRLPYLNKLVLEILGEKDEQLEKFRSGELDFYSLRGQDYSVLVGQKEESDFEIYNVGPVASTQFIVMNQNPNALDLRPEVLSWTSNRKFRTAIAHIVDRETIINNIAYGFGYPQYSFIPRFSPYYWENIDEKAYKFNLETADQILDSIGWIDNDGDGFREDGNGIKLSLRMVTNADNDVRQSISELVSQNAAKVGIEINLQYDDFRTLGQKLLSGNDWDMALVGLSGSVDPISGANVYKSQGNLHLIEPNQLEPRRDWEKDVDQAWETANNTIDESTRLMGWQKIQEIWAEELPWIFTYNQALLHAYDSNLGNIQPRPVDGLDEFGIIQYIYWK